MAPLDGEKNRCRKEEGREVERRKEGRKGAREQDKRERKNGRCNTTATKLRGATKLHLTCPVSYM